MKDKLMELKESIKERSTETIVSRLVSEGMGFQAGQISLKELQEVKRISINEIRRRIRA